MNKATLLFFILFPITFTAQSAVAPFDCLDDPADGFVIGYFNGIDNTHPDAEGSLTELRDRLGNTYNGEPLNYCLFFNISFGFFNDLAETIKLRANEIDESGEIADRYSYLFLEKQRSPDSLLDNLNDSDSTIVRQSTPAIADFSLKISDEALASLVSAVAKVVSDPPTPTDETIQDQIDQADFWASEGHRMLFVGHSAGNLFLNIVFDYIVDNYGSDRVASVHVAPASPTVRGPHVLSSSDRVIKRLRDRVSGGVQPVTIDLPETSVDPRGHNFVNIYLDDSNSRIGTLRSTGAGSTAYEHFYEHFLVQIDSILNDLPPPPDPEPCTPTPTMPC